MSCVISKVLFLLRPDDKVVNALTHITNDLVIKKRKYVVVEESGKIIVAHC